METKHNLKEPFLIADSSGLISLTSQTDRNHSRALAAADRLDQSKATILVSYDVYAETINIVGKKQGHSNAYEVGRLLSTTAPFLIIDSSPAARGGGALPPAQALPIGELYGCHRPGGC